MVEDAAIANQLEALVTKRDNLPRKLLSSLGTERSHPHPTFDGCGRVNSAMERRNRSNGTNENISQGRIFMVFTHSSQPTSSLSKIFDLSRTIVWESFQAVIAGIKEGNS